MKGDKKTMPEILVMGGSMGSLDALAATLTKMFKEKLPPCAIRRRRDKDAVRGKGGIASTSQNRVRSGTYKVADERCARILKARRPFTAEQTASMTGSVIHDHS